MNNARQLALWIAAAADATNPNGFGGLPYHLVQAGRSIGVIDGGFAFSTSGRWMRSARVAWNAAMFARTGRHGGFQYSETFLRRMWRSVPRPLGDLAIVNVFQLFPDTEMERSSIKLFYLDQTLNDLFHYYGTGANMSNWWQNAVLDRERQQYRAARRVIFRSRWAADRAIANYGLPEDKVRVVLPGANISEDVLFSLDKTGPEECIGNDDLKLVFVGKDWRRKGLDRLLRAMQLAQAQGARLALTVIGTKAQEVPYDHFKALDVRWIGYFDKARDPLGFARLISSHDVGVLLSRSEAGGLSLREFGRLGLPVIAPRTGGSPEFAMSESAMLFSIDAPDAAIAQVLLELEADRSAVVGMKAEAWTRRLTFDWRTSVRQLVEAL